MRPVVVLLGLCGFSTAQAGGFGLILNGGVHTESVRYYSSYDYNTQSGEPVPFETQDEYAQYEMTQTLSNMGAGLELVLGDRDDRVVGSFRIYLMRDAAQQDPRDSATIQPEHVVSDIRERNRDVGMGMVGLTWGFIGRPSGFMAGLSAYVGSGFLTWDEDGGPLAHTEFLSFQIGPAAMYRIGRAFQLNADVSYQGRFRKGFSHGVTGTLGMRYMFD